MRWLLPEYIEDILPAEAARIEALRRRILDLFAAHGYQLVMPPLLEYLESLLTGTGRDLDLRTFKLVDQLSGRMMGLRADITPQVARLDAHLLNRQGVARLCYCGSVLHARPAGLESTREPLQIGAEVYGHAGVESDLVAVLLHGGPAVYLHAYLDQVSGGPAHRRPSCRYAVVIVPAGGGRGRAAGFDIRVLSLWVWDGRGAGCGAGGW